MGFEYYLSWALVLNKLRHNLSLHHLSIREEHEKIFLGRWTTKMWREKERTLVLGCHRGGPEKRMMLLVWTHRVKNEVWESFKDKFAGERIRTRITLATIYGSSAFIWGRVKIMEYIQIDSSFVKLGIIVSYGSCEFGSCLCNIVFLIEIIRRPRDFCVSAKHLSFVKNIPPLGKPCYLNWLHFAWGKGSSVVSHCCVFGGELARPAICISHLPVTWYREAFSSFET